MRFAVLISPLWRPLLLPFGATSSRAYAEVADGQLRVRLGWLFDQRFPLDEIEAASPSHWPVWAGIGWRTNFRGTVGVIGTFVNIVEVRFKQPQRVRVLLPTTCRRLYLSLEEPREFISALQTAAAGQAQKEPAAAKTRPRRRKTSA